MSVATAESSKVKRNGPARPEVFRLDDPTFVAGDVATDFIDAHPELAQVNRSQDRGSKQSYEVEVVEVPGL